MPAQYLGLKVTHPPTSGLNARKSVTYRAADNRALPHPMPFLVGWPHTAHRTTHRHTSCHTANSAMPHHTSCTASVMNMTKCMIHEYLMIVLSRITATHRKAETTY